MQMIGQFFDVDLEDRKIVVKEGDTLELGSHTLHFVMAPMVHWPEVMVSYEASEKILFSADAFGTFGALNGNLFNDDVDFEKDWIDDARRYFTNIVGKYGMQVQTLLKKAAGLDIQMICSRNMTSGVSMSRKSRQLPLSMARFTAIQSRQLMRWQQSLVQKA